MNWAVRLGTDFVTAPDGSEMGPLLETTRRG
jgi:hypothetical protein